MPSINNGYAFLKMFNTYEKIYNPLAYFISNFDYVYSGSSLNITGNTSMVVNNGDIIKPIFTAENPFQEQYLEINLNDYAYVALALKDYNQDPFNTNMYFKGQVCLTPVYNYGME